MLASERLENAKALLAAGRFAGAYYLAGYCVECGLKACISRKTKADDFPPKDANKYYTHDLQKLLDVADLRRTLDDNALLRANWTLVAEWTEECRYATRGDVEAADMIAALTDETDGVFEWLRQNW